MIRSSVLIHRRKHIIISIAIALVIGICIFGIIYGYFKRHKENETVVSELEDIAAPSLNLKESVILPNSRYNDKGFTCTGMAYDPLEDCFWVCNFGRILPNEGEHRPSIIKLSRNIKLQAEYDFNLIEDDEYNRNLQGIAYDSKEDSLWVSGGKQLINVSKDGKLISKVQIDWEECQLNGVAYDEATDSIWVLCSHDYLLNVNKDGSIIKRIECDIYAQDQLAYSESGELYFTAGADYTGNQNFLFKMDVNTGECSPCYQLVNSYAVEGICFVDGLLYVMNDGFYHSALISENIVNVYQFY